MCCSQCHPHLSNSPVSVGLLHWWVTSGTSMYIYPSTSTPQSQQLPQLPSNSHFIPVPCPPSCSVANVCFYARAKQLYADFSNFSATYIVLAICCTCTPHTDWGHWTKWTRENKNAYVFMCISNFENKWRSGGSVKEEIHKECVKGWGNRVHNIRFLMCSKRENKIFEM